MEAGQEGSDRTDATAGNQSSGGPSRRGLLIGGAIVIGLLLLAVGTIALILIAAPGGPDGGRGGGRATAPERFEEKYTFGRGADKIAVLPIVGQIGIETSIPTGSLTATPETLRDQLHQAAEDERVRAVILEIDSPGGGVVPTDQMHKSIRDFKEKTKKPVVASMGQTAASGGYYVATAADEIVANEITLTGSLGVIFSYLNLEEAADKLGIEQEVIKSGRFKDIGSSTREPTEEELEILQAYVDEGYDKFVQVIVEGRNLSEDRVRELADGRVYSGLQAESLGLIDELGDLEKAVGSSARLAGLEEATVVRYQRTPGFIDLLRARLTPPESETLQTLKAAGLNPTPELQYLYRP
jgi:protease-4